jgi:hypothetical protein
VLTAAITGAIAWILSQFGIAPGPYLVVVAAVVKGIIILVGVLLGAKVVKKRVQAKQAAGQPPVDPASSGQGASAPDRTKHT